jgi:hypothetical protein
LRLTGIFFATLAGLLCAQTPEIGSIEIYGLRKVPESRIRTALGFSEGAPLPRSKADIEDRLANLPGIVGAQLEATCCDDGKIILYVGIEEKGARHFDLRTPPEEEIELPEEIVHAYRDFLTGCRRGRPAGFDCRGSDQRTFADGGSGQPRYSAKVRRSRRETREATQRRRAPLG